MRLAIAMLLLGGCINLRHEQRSECPDRASSSDWFQTPNCYCPKVSELGPALDGKECTMPNTTCYGRSLTAPSCTCVYTAYQPSRWSCGTVDMTPGD